MAIFTATQNGDMDSAATFGGAGTPVSGDEIALGGYTVYCSSDKRALASGISISGTGTLLIKSGGAFKTAAYLPDTCTLQFGEPEGTGDGPLPAVGSLDANASGEVLLNGSNIAVLGPCVVYATKRSGRGYGIVTGTTSGTISIMDEATTDWQAGDAVTPIGLVSAHEYIVEAWDSGAKQLTHSAVSSGYNAVGVLMARMSCAAHIRRIVSSAGILVQSGISGQGDIYLYSLSNTNSYGGCAGALALNGRLATNMRAGSASASINAIHKGYGVIDELMTPGQISTNSVSRLAIGSGVIRTLGSGISATMCISDARIMDMIVPPGIGYKFNVTFCDCVLPSPLISGSLAGLQTIRVMSSGGISDVLHSAGGVATKVQHASLPGTNDLPDAFLLAPVSGRAVYDYFITVRRGQTVRIRYHAWRSSAGARCGYDIYDAALGVEGVSQPLQSYELSTDTDILEWQRPTPEIYCNKTERDLLLLVRAWASGDNVYARCAPEQGGGEL